MRRLIVSAAVGALSLGLAGTGYAAGDQAKQQKSQQQQMGQVQINQQEIEKVMGTDAKVFDLTSLDSEKIKSLQQELQNRGYYQGQVDGVAGPGTTEALRQFAQHRFDLTQQLLRDNKVTDDIATTLGLDVQDIQPVRGEELGGQETDKQKQQKEQQEIEQQQRELEQQRQMEEMEQEPVEPVEPVEPIEPQPEEF